MKYEAILFDMNGVLVDDEHLHESAFRQVLEQLGQTLTPDEYKSHFAGRTDREGFESYFSANGLRGNIQHLMKTKSEQYQLLAEQGVESYEGVQEFIEHAISKGLKLAVVTSSAKQETSSLLDGIGIAHNFAATITADDINEGKPSPEGYLKAAEQLEVEPSKCLVIEDAPTGIMAAKQAGMYCVAVTNTHSSGELNSADVVTTKLDSSVLFE